MSGFGLIPARAGTTPTIAERQTAKFVGLVRADATAPVAEWAATFDLLNRRHTPQRVSRVLGWFGRNRLSTGVPPIDSVKAFAQHFPTLCRLMKSPQEGDDPLADLTQEILRQGWPSGSDRCLAAALRESARNYATFVETLARVEPTLDPACQRLLRHLRCVLFTSPRDFLRIWFADVRDDIFYWRGGPSFLVFDPKSARSYRLIGSCCYDYCGDSTRWERILTAAGLNS